MFIFAVQFFQSFIDKCFQGSRTFCVARLLLRTSFVELFNFKHFINMSNYRKLQHESKLSQDRLYLASWKLTKFHHYARSRGYWPTTKNEYLEPYCGKFGKGFIRRFSSRYSVPRSNNYHTIEYWIFSDK